MQKFYTIGYEGASLGDFLDTLVSVEVDRVIDIRDVPASRRAGFSKNSLRAALAEHGIEYTHFKPLGDPKAGREAMRRGDVKEFTKIFEQHIQSNGAQEALKNVVEIACQESVALLCFERDPKYCHRTIVAARMCELASLEAKHIGVKKQKGSAIERATEVHAEIG